MQQHVLLFASLVSSVFEVLVQAGPGIDYTRCTTLNGWHGENVQCVAGYFVTALCASGRLADCNGGGAYTQVTCCPQQPWTGNGTCGSGCTRCSLLEGAYGQQLTCPGGAQVVSAACTSGLYLDCGYEVAQRAVCCADHDFEISETCQWFYGGYGQKVECPLNWVMRGQCSSGSKLDCNGASASHGAYCCQLVVD